MTLLRTLALFTFVAGLGLLVVGYACSGSSAKQAATVESPTATSTPTDTPTLTPTSTPTPTPTPFAGKIARFQIPRFKVDAPIEELAINARNELDTPKDTNRAVGWYYIYDRPGWGGNAVFSAHVYYHSIPAPFVSLAKSQIGDEVNIVMEDGTRYSYKVISNKRYTLTEIKMGEIIWPPDRGGKEWITMITCGGELDSSGQEYLSRDVIVAERVE